MYSHSIGTFTLDECDACTAAAIAQKRERCKAHGEMECVERMNCFPRLWYVRAKFIQLCGVAM